MKKVFFIVSTVIFVLMLLPVSVFCQELINEIRYELPGYGTSINVSNVVSDNSDTYTKTIRFGEGETAGERQVVISDLNIEATAPCKITYGLGDQYIHYAKKMADGSLGTDYERDINLDVNKRTLFTYGNYGPIFGATVDTALDNSGMDTGAEGNHVTLNEGVYIVSNYTPGQGIGGGQSFEDYRVVLTVKGSSADDSDASVDNDTTPAISAPATATAVPNTSKVLVNNTAKTFEAYTISGNNYFKLRDLATVLNGTSKHFEVTWDGTKNAINLITNKEYTVVGGELKIDANLKEQNAVLSTAKIYIDGQQKALTAYTIKGNSYFKLRDIAQVFDIGVTWDGNTSTVGIDTSIGYAQ